MSRTRLTGANGRRRRDVNRSTVPETEQNKQEQEQNTINSSKRYNMKGNENSKKKSARNRKAYKQERNQNTTVANGRIVREIKLNKTNSTRNRRASTETSAEHS